MIVVYEEVLIASNVGKGSFASGVEDQFKNSTSSLAKQRWEYGECSTKFMTCRMPPVLRN